MDINDRDVTLSYDQENSVKVRLVGGTTSLSPSELRDKVKDFVESNWKDITEGVGYIPRLFHGTNMIDIISWLEGYYFRKFLEANEKAEKSAFSVTCEKSSITTEEIGEYIAHMMDTHAERLKEAAVKMRRMVKDTVETN